MRHRVRKVRSLAALSATLVVAIVCGAMAAGGAQARSVLAYVGNGSGEPTQQFSKFAAASGTNVTVTDQFPADLSANSCVILHINQLNFAPSQTSVMSSYLAGGGTLIALGEYAQFQGGLPRTVMNGVATAVGSSMSLGSQGLDFGVATTTNIGIDPLTAGVFSLVYGGPGAVNTPGTARWLAKNVDGVTFMGAQKVGAGTFVLSGDSNVLSDTSNNGYVTANNGVLARNLCGDTTPPVVQIDVPIDTKVYKAGAVVPADFRCIDPEGTNDIASVQGTVADGDPIDTSGPVGQTVLKSFTVTCTDESGLSATKTVTYYVDNQPPVVTISSPLDGGEITQGSSVLADFGCTDDEGVGSVTGTVPQGQPVNTTTLGQQTFSVSCTDIAGNIATKTVQYTVVDHEPPSVSISSPVNGARYRVGQVIPGNFSCTDEDGPQDILFCTGPVALGSPINTALGAAGSNIFTVNASDKAGNLASKSVQYIVDASPPAVTIMVPGDGAKYTQGAAVPADYSCSDPDDAPPGFVDVVSCNGPVPDGELIDTSTPGKKTFQVSGSDQAGNTASAAHTYIVAGKNPPSVTIQSPANNATFGLNATIPLNFSCSDPDGPDDLVSCQRVAASGPLDSSKAGTFEVTVEAVDQAGNRATKTHKYVVTAKPAPSSVAPTTAGGATKRVCKSRRQFRIRVKKTKKRQRVRIVSAVVYVNGKRTQTKKGRRVTAVVTLKGLPKGRYRVVIKAKLSDGRTITDTRRFRTCTAKGKT